MRAGSAQQVLKIELHLLKCPEQGLLCVFKSVMTHCLIHCCASHCTSAMLHETSFTSDRSDLCCLEDQCKMEFREQERLQQSKRATSTFCLQHSL